MAYSGYGVCIQEYREVQSFKCNEMYIVEALNLSTVVFMGYFSKILLVVKKNGTFLQMTFGSPKYEYFE